MATPMVSPRYEKALTRNLAELQKALLIRTTILGIEDQRYASQIFTRVVHDALHNDYMSHAIKVFEQSSKASSFWYLYRTDPRAIDKHARHVGYTLADLQAVSDKLKIVRNGTHFHIDSAGVLDPGAVWHGADLTGKELAAALDFAWGALRAVQDHMVFPETSLLGYTRQTAHAAVKRIEAGDA